MTKKEYSRQKQMEKERPANENLMNDWDKKAFDDMGASNRSSELGHICSSGFGDNYNKINGRNGKCESGRWIHDGNKMVKVK